jgi:hypothetical protein
MLLSTVVQDVVTLNNPTNVTVSYQFRWSPSAAWSNATIAPNTHNWYWTPANSSVSPQVNFDYSFNPGFQGKTYSLGFTTYTSNGNPPSTVGKPYSFALVPGGVDLYSNGTVDAVIDLSNPTSASIVYEVRMNNNGPWVTYTLPAHSTSWFWAPVKANTGPQIEFDYSFAAGFQGKFYNLNYNMVNSTGTPPSNSGHYYTFALANGGVDLFG